MRVNWIRSAVIALACCSSCWAAPDLNGDQVVNEYDVDYLLDGVLRHQQGEYVCCLDVNRDGELDAMDLVDWLHSISDLPRGFYSPWGDANVDGHFNSGDFVQVFARGKYETALADDAGWGDGDFSGNWDLDFDSSDLVNVLANGTYDRVGAIGVPEPNGWLCLAVLLLVIVVAFRRVIR